MKATRFILLAKLIFLIVVSQVVVPTSMEVDKFVYKHTYNKLAKQYTWMSSYLYDIICGASRQYNIAPEIVSAFIDAESRGVARARSYANARGLMQIMSFWYPGNISDLYIPSINIYLGVKILRYCITRAKGNLILAAKYYNAGNTNYFNGPYIIRIVRNIAISSPKRTMSDIILKL